VRERALTEGRWHSTLAKKLIVRSELTLGSTAMNLRSAAGLAVELEIARLLSMSYDPKGCMNVAGFF